MSTEKRYIAMAGRSLAKSTVDDIAHTMEKEIRNIVLNKLGEEKVIKSINAYQDGEDKKSKNYLSLDERIDIVILYALRYTDKQIMDYLNSKRRKLGMQDINIRSYYTAKRRYAKLIDEVYATIAINIGEVFPFSDKLHRIMRLNDIAFLLHNRINNMTEIDKDYVVVVNLFLKVIERMDKELGGIALSDMIHKFDSNPFEQELTKQISDKIKDNLPNYVKKILKERYKAQLPDIDDEAEITSVENVDQ